MYELRSHSRSGGSALDCFTFTEPNVAGRENRDEKPNEHTPGTAGESVPKLKPGRGAHQRGRWRERHTEEAMARAILG